MFRQLINYKIILCLLIVSVLGLQTNVFSFDLVREISSRFEKYYNGIDDTYLNDSYSSNYSKDPFGDALKAQTTMAINKKVKGAQRVETALQSSSCSLSPAKTWAILYYFSPDFRAELSYDIKVNSDDEEDKTLQISENLTRQYCEEFFSCKQIHNIDPTDDNVIITSGTPEESMANCKEFFLAQYEQGEAAENRIQFIQKSQLGADKFFNATLDDSPYDLMTDLDTVGMLMFKDSQAPVQAVFYHLPIFSKSEEHILNGESSREVKEVSDDRGDDENNDDSGKDGSNTANQNNGGGDGSTRGSTIDLGNKGTNSQEQTDDDQVGSVDIYQVVDDETKGFIRDGLISWTLKDKTVFHGQTCVGNELEEIDFGEESNDNSTKTINPLIINGDKLDFTPEEYEEFVDAMLKNVNKYAEMDDETREEVENANLPTTPKDPAPTPEDLEEQAEEILTCMSKCEGLRFDQKASCAVMCACNEVHSTVFDPKQFPGLGPIMSVRFCAVPAVSSKFSVGGTKIFSIEEGILEIYGVVDKLSREGKLGMWVPQHNFLDSSTKKMDFGKAITFTLSIEFADLASKMFVHSHSEQFDTMTIKDDNEALMQTLGISNPLNDPVLKNKYRLVSSDTENMKDYLAIGDASVAVENKENVIYDATLMGEGDLTRAERYITIAGYVDSWAEQQKGFWETATEYANDWGKLAQYLYSKK